MLKDDPELRRIVERARIELLYARSALRVFQWTDDPGRPNADDEAILNSVGALMSKATDAIREAEKLITKLN